MNPYEIHCLLCTERDHISFDQQPSEPTEYLTQPKTWLVSFDFNSPKTNELILLKFCSKKDAPKESVNWKKSLEQIFLTDCDLIAQKLLYWLYLNFAAIKKLSRGRCGENFRKFTGEVKMDISCLIWKRVMSQHHRTLWPAGLYINRMEGFSHQQFYLPQRSPFVAEKF